MRAILTELSRSDSGQQLLQQERSWYSLPDGQNKYTKYVVTKKQLNTVGLTTSRT